MKRRFFVWQGVACWHLCDRSHVLSNGMPASVQTFPTRAEARKWAKLANTPNAALAWGNTGLLISVTIADGASASIHHV